MEENKMYLVNKFFNSETIRTVWNKEGKSNFSVLSI